MALKLADFKSPDATFSRGFGLLLVEPGSLPSLSSKMKVDNRFEWG